MTVPTDDNLLISPHLHQKRLLGMTVTSQQSLMSEVSHWDGEKTDMQRAREEKTPETCTKPIEQKVMYRLFKECFGNVLAH